MSKTVTTTDDSIVGGGPSVPAANISRAEIHDVLSNERRIALLELLRAESPRKLGDLAEEIAAEETGERPPPRNKRQSAYVTLHQTHLPKLDDLGIVEYDAREKVVALADQASVVYDSESDGTATSRTTGVEPYLGLVVGGLLASLASAAGLPPFSALSLTAYALATLVALLVGFAYQIGRDGSVVATWLREKYF